MFPHTITVFQKQENSYKRTVIDGVIWYGSDGLSIDGKGIKEDNSINVIIPIETLDTNNLASFIVSKDDKIVKGEVDNIKKSITELNQYKDVLTVTSVNNYDFGSGLDCILIGGK